MLQKMNEFVDYLTNVKRASKNTIASYKRDLLKLNTFLTDSGCEDLKNVDVKEVKEGFECGLVFKGFDQMKELDIVEAYIMVEVPR